uniref:vomeronasal type-1 receptor 4-like n=1 Tax=Jaculus jaculus TaxID=51337 RepID=UPI001E1B3816|nr:vomeronasal type-1 receptor 4-like [Jaculus jaculus]
MSLRALAMKIIFLSQTALGILGNSACLCHFILTDFTRSRAKPTDLIAKHLTWANLMVFLFKGVPHTMATFGHVHFLDDISCKLVFYFHRVARGVSLSSTALLSVTEAIIISHSTPLWVQLKNKVDKIVRSSLVLCWALHILVNIFIFMRVTDVRHTANLTGFRDFVYCAISDAHSLSNTVCAVVVVSIDVTCVGLMMWTSGSMVLMLLKHRQRVQHLHSSLSVRSSPETRATQSVLALVSSFVLFYVTSAILSVCFPFFDSTTMWLVNANVAMSACFPALCPFLLLNQYSSASRLCITKSHKTGL